MADLDLRHEPARDRETGEPLAWPAALDGEVGGVCPAKLHVLLEERVL